MQRFKNFFISILVPFAACAGDEATSNMEATDADASMHNNTHETDAGSSRHIEDAAPRSDTRFLSMCAAAMMAFGCGADAMPDDIETDAINEVGDDSGVISPDSNPATEGNGGAGGSLEQDAGTAGNGGVSGNGGEQSSGGSGGSGGQGGTPEEVIKTRDMVTWEDVYLPGVEILIEKVERNPTTRKYKRTGEYSVVRPTLFAGIFGTIFWLEYDGIKSQSIPMSLAIRHANQVEADLFYSKTPNSSTTRSEFLGQDNGTTGYGYRWPTEGFE